MYEIHEYVYEIHLLPPIWYNPPPPFNLPHWKRRPRPQKTTPNPGDAGASPAGNHTKLWGRGRLARE